MSGTGPPANKHMEDVHMSIAEIIAMLGFGLTCFKIGYNIGKDVMGHRKSRQ